MGQSLRPHIMQPLMRKDLIEINFEITVLLSCTFIHLKVQEGTKKITNIYILPSKALSTTNDEKKKSSKIPFF